MKVSLLFLFLVLITISCHKNNSSQSGCNIQEVISDNSKKVTIANGIWGTVSSMEGNCMPTVPPSTNTCKNCPVQRTLKIYQYATQSDVITNDPYKIFFDSCTTLFVAQVNADQNGFFQIDIPPGHYSIFIVENGKLYANSLDGQGGLSPFVFTTGKLNINLTMTYKAVF